MRANSLSTSLTNDNNPPLRFVQESIYQSCLVSTRKQVHKSIAKYLELEKSSHLSDFYGTIAYHYEAAEEWRSACLYLQLNSEINEQLHIPKAVVSSLEKWLKIKQAMNDAHELGGRAVNGRYESPKIEEGIV